jgi:hypothetical protein
MTFQPKQTLQHVTQQQQNLQQKPLVLQQIAPLKLQQVHRAQLIRLCQQQLKLSLAVTRTAIAWKKCSRRVCLSNTTYFEHYSDAALVAAFFMGLEQQRNADPLSSFFIRRPTGEGMPVILSRHFL